jgi:hypothetical protein
MAQWVAPKDELKSNGIRTRNETFFTLNFQNLPDAYSQKQDCNGFSAPASIKPPFT